MAGITKEEQKRRKQARTNKKISETMSKDKESNITKLRQAFAIGANITIACRYAGITTKTYYEWIKKDEKLSNEFAQLRDQPILKSLKTITNSLDQPAYAFKYAEKKLPDEFGDKTTIKHEGSIETYSEETTKGVNKAIKAFNETMRIALTKKKKNKTISPTSKNIPLS